jgi:hypothetical protein
MVGDKMSMINNKTRKILFALTTIISMFCGSFLNGDEKDDDLYLQLKNVVANMPSKHNITARGYMRNALRVAMLLNVNYEEFYFVPKEYAAIKKIFKDRHKTIKHILCLMVIEKFDEMGTLYYGFLEKNENLHDAMNKILASENGSYKIELDTNGKLNWLSKDTYALKLSYTHIATINEALGSAIIALTGFFDEISIIKVGISGWENSDKCGINPNTFVHNLYDYATDDFIKKAKNNLRKQVQTPMTKDTSIQ